MLKQCPKCKCVSLNCIEEEKKNPKTKKMTCSLLLGGRDVCNSSISQRRTDPVSCQNVTDTLLAAEPCKLSTGCARITADNRERLIISLAAAATGCSIIRTANKAQKWAAVAVNVPPSLHRQLTDEVVGLAQVVVPHRHLQRLGG